MIKLIKCTGTGQTKLGAFDNALYNCGIHNHNLIYLSSVIPSGQKVVLQEKFIDSKRWGSKLYVVMAHEESDITAKASIGWLIDEVSGNGLLVEHSGEFCEELNSLTLEDLANTRNITNYEKNIQNVEIKSTGDEYVCAMVVAIFEEEDWVTL